MTSDCQTREQHIQKGSCCAAEVEDVSVKPPTQRERTREQASERILAFRGGSRGLAHTQKMLTRRKSERNVKRTCSVHRTTEWREPPRTRTHIHTNYLLHCAAAAAATLSVRVTHIRYARYRHLTLSKKKGAAASYCHSSHWGVTGPGGTYRMRDNFDCCRFTHPSPYPDPSSGGMYKQVEWVVG